MVDELTFWPTSRSACVTGDIPVQVKDSFGDNTTVLRIIEAPDWLVHGPSTKPELAPNPVDKVKEPNGAPPELRTWKSKTTKSPTFADAPESTCPVMRRDTAGSEVDVPGPEGAVRIRGPELSPNWSTVVPGT
jgi:hypothetical protein